jgi:hypothetical protein
MYKPWVMQQRLCRKYSAEVEALRLRLAKEKPECSQSQRMKVQFEAKAMDKQTELQTKSRKKRGTGKKVVASRKPSTLVITEKESTSDDMNPTLRGVDFLDVSFGTAADLMVYNDSILGKRQVAGLFGYGQDAQHGKALVPFVDVPTGGSLKKGKTEGQQLEEEVTSKGREVDMEAAGLGAASDLTGPMELRQKQ